MQARWCDLLIGLDVSPRARSLTRVTSYNLERKGLLGNPEEAWCFVAAAGGKRHDVLGDVIRLEFPRYSKKKRSRAKLLDYA